MEFLKCVTNCEEINRDDEADAIKVARKLQAGETVQDVTEELIEHHHWHVVYQPH